ncbi:pentatricopeptide repeat-containing protein At1g62680, mitochondrial-like [Coffea eugenioides]|uniref:pentatricopeptide repeat-containing protein At1g62680, mitochondrial-like n=1 Tax=Coffea eugenioides TaxID=49369 RepID=UPI000F6058E0|nr:pentatricopeptide repeat-containing protein At1g62680, mitochondrial-like [Coffea eugenioides]
MKKRPFSVVCDAHLRHKSGAGGTATCTATLSFLSPRNSTLIQNTQSASSSAASHAYSTGSTISNHHPKSDSSVRSGSWGLRSNIDSISNLDEALGFYKQMARMRPLPSVAHFNRLLGRIVKMKQYLITMYNIVLDGLCKCGKLDSARHLFYSLSSKGLDPNVTTYNTAGEFNDAVVYFDEMDRRGFSLHLSTFSFLLDSYRDSGNDPSIFKIIEKFAPKMCRV